jgi:hypothetical protein
LDTPAPTLQPRGLEAISRHGLNLRVARSPILKIAYLRWERAIARWQREF